MLAGALSLVIMPVSLAFIRHIEHESDRFGLELLQENDAVARAFVALQTEDLGYPRPGLLYKILRASHPPLGKRIDFCNASRPWEHDQPMRYADRFR